MIIAPPPIPINLKGYLSTRNENDNSTVQYQRLLRVFNKCLDIKKLIRNLTTSESLRVEEEFHGYDDYVAVTSDSDNDLQYLHTQFLINFIFMPLLLILFAVLLILTVYYIYNRYVFKFLQLLKHSFFKILCV